MHERTFIGLDVHARSVQAGVLDGLTGEVKSLAVPVATKALVAWVCAQPAPAVTYEAGPTGYELARALLAAGAGCAQTQATSALVATGTARLFTSPVSPSSTPAWTERACTSRPMNVRSCIATPPRGRGLPSRCSQRRPAPDYALRRRAVPYGLDSITSLILSSRLRNVSAS